MNILYFVLIFLINNDCLNNKMSKLFGVMKSLTLSSSPSLSHCKYKSKEKPFRLAKEMANISNCELNMLNTYDISFARTASTARL